MRLLVRPRRIYLTLDVDDLLLAGNNSESMSMVKKKLQKRFKMTDMGPASLVLGMEIKRDCEQSTPVSYTHLTLPTIYSV